MTSTEIQDYLDILRNSINNNEIYEWFLKWVSSVAFNSEYSSCVMPVIINGNTPIIDILFETIQNSISIHNLNEAFVDNSKYIKSVESGSTSIIRLQLSSKLQSFKRLRNMICSKNIILGKGNRERTKTLYLNYIITSDIKYPIKDMIGNTLILYIDLPKHINHNLIFDSEFKENLLKYLMYDVDTTDFDPKDLILKYLHKIDMSFNPILERQLYSTSNELMNIIRNVDKYIDGVSVVPNKCMELFVYERGIYKLLPKHELIYFYNIVNYYRRKHNLSIL